MKLKGIGFTNTSSWLSAAWLLLAGKDRASTEPRAYRGSCPGLLPAGVLAEEIR
jgi:hypothetical protein